MNNTTIHSNHNHVPSVHGFTYGIAFTIGMLILVVVILLACVKLRLPLNLVQLGWRGQPNTTASVQPFVVEVTEQRGIDHDTLQSYRKVLYSEVVQDGGGLVSCSVCLDDYEEDDVLRMLPDCGHLFHLSCIDSWLQSHPTCPICRSSPAPGSQSTGVVTVEEEHVAITVE